MSATLTTAEVAEDLGKTMRTIINWRSKGYGPPYLQAAPGCTVEYPLDAYKRWKSEHYLHVNPNDEKSPDADQPAG